jgi:integrase
VRAKVKRTFRTYPEANRWRTQNKGKVATGARIAQTQKTLNQAAADWLAGASADPPTVLTRGGTPYKPSVVRSYRRDLDKYILSDLGAHKLGSIGRGDLKRLITRLVGQGLSPSKVRNIVNPLRAIYREALDAEEVEVNPTAGLRLPRVPDPQRRTVGVTAMFTYLDALPEDLEALYATAFFAGLRRGEIRALRWNDVLLNEGTGPYAGWIAVTRAWDDVEGVVEPKSNAGVRRTPILRPYLSERLVALRERTSRQGDDLVFGTEARVPFEPTRLLRQVAKALVPVNAKREKGRLELIEKVDLQGARHTWGEIARSAGVLPDDIKEYLGHARAGVTARYTRLSDDEYEARMADNSKLMVDFLAQAETSSRIQVLGTTALSADAVLAAFDGDREGLKRLLDDLRQRVQPQRGA